MGFTEFKELWGALNQWKVSQGHRFFKINGSFQGSHHNLPSLEGVGGGCYVHFDGGPSTQT